MTRAAIDARVSRKGQVDDGSGLPTQEERARRNCAEHGRDVGGDREEIDAATDPADAGHP